jgi:thiamine pyrophosphokinase
VSIEGVRWELRGVELRQGHPFAISNLPVKRRVRVSLESGVLGVYCLFGENL